MSSTPRPSPARRNLLRLLNGFERVALGPLLPNVHTASETVWMWERSTLLRFVRAQYPPRHRIPVIIVPPLMVKPVIFDLRPGHSMVAHLCERGFDTWMVDYGIPRDTDRTIRVDDYVTDFIPNAVDKVLEKTGAPAVSLIGWSMGGIMSYTYCALRGRDARVRNLVTIGSPLDFSKMFPFNVLARISQLPGTMRLLDRLGNIPPVLTRNSFKLLAPTKLVTRQFALVQNYWDRDWVAGNEALGNWVDEFIPYPGEAFKQFVQDFVRDDKLRRGQLSMGGQTVDLSRIDTKLLVVIGTDDDVAPQASVAAALDEIPVADKEALRVPLGHIGLVAGSRAPDLVWDPLANWLSPRSEPLRRRGAA